MATKVKSEPQSVLFFDLYGKLYREIGIRVGNDIMESGEKLPDHLTRKQIKTIERLTDCLEIEIKPDGTAIVLNRHPRQRNKKL